MALPPKPDTPGTPPASSTSPAPTEWIYFVPTERIYYPRPYRTRLIPNSEYGVSLTAQLDKMEIEIEYAPDGRQLETYFYVEYSYTIGQFTEFGTMELSEWQKLPPVPLS